MAKKTKPRKPSKTFPLFAHNNGSWAKKIRGKLHYFGGWGDPESALKRYRVVAADLEAGRQVSIPRGRLAVRDLCNRFLTNRRRALESGDIVERTFYDYRRACGYIVQYFGKTREVEAMRPIDFEQFRAALAKNWGPVRLRSEMTKIRTVFRFAYDNHLIDRPVRYGSGFQPPGKKALARAKLANGPKMFEADEIRAILAGATEPMRTMVLLGINCGFGPTDCGRLPVHSLDLAGGWASHARPKTCVERRCPLWPETVEALRGVIGDYPDGLVFHTRSGRAWEGLLSHPISTMFGRLVRRLDLYRPGRGFYALRHTHATISGDAKDQVATNAIMGHSDSSMAAVYRERIEDARLAAVSDHVRRWLFELDGSTTSPRDQEEAHVQSPTAGNSTSGRR